MEHFFSPNSGEDQKKKVFTKKGTLFSPNSSGDLRSDAHQSQIIGGVQMYTILKLLGGIQSNYWGDISPIPPGFGTPDGMEWNRIFGMKCGKCQNGMEWNGRFQQWNGRQSSIPIPY